MWELVGPEWQDLDFVFTNPFGKPLRPFYVGHKSFKALLKKAGLPDMRFHDLRHSTASLLLALGVHPKVVSEQLGHSTIQLTLDTYSHALPTLQAEAARKLGSLLEREGG
jgi:integrase